jgi:hypothetical protein
MIDRVERENGAIRCVHRRISVVRDALIDQHRFGGVALMPGVGFMELMAEVYSLLEKDRSGAHLFRNMAFSDAFRLYRDQPRDATVAIDPGSVAGRYLLRIIAPLRTALSTAPEIRQYASAEVSVEPITPEGLDAESWDLGNVREGDFKEMLDRGAAGRSSVVLGPLFNDANREGRVEPALPVMWGEKGILTPVRFPKAQLHDERYPIDKYLLNPCFLDAMHQAGAIFAQLLTERVFLPVGAEEFAVVAPPKTDGTYRVYVKVKRRGGEEFIYDIAMLDERGSLSGYAKNAKFCKVS